LDYQIILCNPRIKKKQLNLDYQIILCNLRIKKKQLNIVQVVIKFDNIKNKHKFWSKIKNNKLISKNLL
jgi:hypothetical protein